MRIFRDFKTMMYTNMYIKIALIYFVLGLKFRYCSIFLRQIETQAQLKTQLKPCASYRTCAKQQKGISIESKCGRPISGKQLRSFFAIVKPNFAYAILDAKVNNT